MKNKIVKLATIGVLCSTFLVGTNFAVTAALTNSNLVAARPTSSGLSEITAQGTLSNGSSLEGTLSITELVYNPDTKQLTANGSFVYGSRTTIDGITLLKQPVTNIPVELRSTRKGKQAGGSCDIIFLDLGPIFLDALGLTVDLSEITLDIDAVRGAGNLLGNLLCGLVGLLDGSGPLDSILDIITRINDLL